MRVARCKPAVKTGPLTTALFGAAFAATAAYGAAVTNIRIAPHGDHVRVVLDLDAPIGFTATHEGGFILKGLESENAVLNAEARDTPLKRVILAPGTEGARLSFETAVPVSPRAFALAPDTGGGNRLVIDLYSRAKESASHTGAAAADDVSAPPPPERASASPTGTSAALPSATQPPPAEYWALHQAQAAVPGMPPAAPIDAPGLPVPSGGPGYSQETLRAERALDRGDATEACLRADSALQVDAKDMRALVVLGLCRMAQRDAAGARAAFASALEHDPGFDRARIGLATAEDMLGNQGAARDELAKVLGHDLPPEELTRLLEAFKTLKAPGSLASSEVQRVVNEGRAVGRAAPIKSDRGSAAAVRGPAE
jgi:hypothetical protein